MATIYDVAKAAKVPIAAVSLVMSDPKTPRMGTQKRKLIFESASKLWYLPNGLARALSRESTKILGLVVPMREPIFFNNFIAGGSCQIPKLRHGARLLSNDLFSQR